MPSLRGNTIHRGRNAIKVSKAMPRYASELVPTLAAPWALPNEAEKEGTGMLFFAYGGEKQVNRFLGEATAAARSIRLYNPNLSIAIVTNNETVDRSVFTHHVVPRGELLFSGSPCPDVCRPDHISRQWTTRLYYVSETEKPSEPRLTLPSARLAKACLSDLALTA